MPSPRNQKHVLQQDVDDYFNGVKRFKKFKDFIKHPDGKITQFNKEIITTDNIKQTLLALYIDPKTGFIGRDKLFEKVKASYVGITRADIIDFLRANSVSQIHQLPTKQKTIVPTIVKKPDKYFLVDLVLGYKLIAPYNDGKEILLTMIDAGTRKAYTRALKNKEAETVADSIIEILTTIQKDTGNSPKILRSDNGSEFISDYLKTRLEKLGIKQIFSQSYSPQENGMIERFNGSIKRKIGLYMTQNDTKRWVDVLQDLTENYNNTVHSSTGKTPNEMSNNLNNAFEEGSNKLEKDAIDTFAQMNRAHPSLEVGDYVRLSLLFDANERRLKAEHRRKDMSVANWSTEIYVVFGISKGRSINPIAPLKERHYKNAKYHIRPVGVYSKDKQIRNVKREYLLLSVHPDDVVNKPTKKEVLQPIDIYDEDDEKLKLQKQALNEQMIDQPIADRVKRVRKPVEEVKDVEVKEVKPAEEVKQKQKADDKLINTDNIFIVDNIVAHKKLNAKNLLYKVRWAGYSENDDTWEPNANFVGVEARAILTAYRKAKKIKGKMK